MEKEKVKVLIVEDEEVSRKTLREAFEKSGYEVEEAENGEEGIRKAKSFLPDLILLDIILPKKDGFEALTEIKKIDQLKEVPVLVLTNLDEIENVQKAIDLGAKNYLVKANYNTSQIVEKADKILSREKKN